MCVCVWVYLQDINGSGIQLDLVYLDLVYLVIRNPNTFSWERIFLVLFVLPNPVVSVSESGQAMQVLSNVVLSIQLGDCMYAGP